MLDEKQAEAALCIWEALIERRERDDDDPDPIVECFEQRGTNEMRHAAIALAPVCSLVFDALPEDERPDCFDWDFVPAFVACMKWDANASSCVEIPSTEQALTLYRDHWKELYGVPA